MNYTREELQMLSEMYNLTPSEIVELFNQGYTEEDLKDMYSPDEEEEDDSSMEEEQPENQSEDEVEYEARMGLSLGDLLNKSVQEYTSKKYVTGGTVEDDCPPGYRKVGKYCEIIDEEGALRAANIPRQLYDIDTENNKAYLGPKETRMLGYSPFVSPEKMHKYLDDQLEDPNSDVRDASRRIGYNIMDNAEYENIETNPMMSFSEPYRLWDDKNWGFFDGIDSDGVPSSVADDFASNLTLPEKFRVGQAYDYKYNDWEAWNDMLKRRDDYLQKQKTPSTPNPQPSVPNPNVVDQTVVPNTTTEPTLSRRDIRQQKRNNKMEPIESRTPRLSTDLSNSPPRDYNFTLPENTGFYTSTRKNFEDPNIPAPKGYWYNTALNQYIPENADEIDMSFQRYYNIPDNEITAFDSNEFDINSRYFNRYEKVTPEQFAAGDLSNERPPLKSNDFWPLYNNDDPKQGEYMPYLKSNNATTTSVQTPTPTQTVASPPPPTTPTTTPSAPAVQTPATPSTTPISTSTPQTAVPAPISTPATPAPVVTTPAPVASTPTPVATSPAPSTPSTPSTPTQPNYTLGPLNTDPTPGSYVPFATPNDESNALYAKEADQRMAVLNKEQDAEEADGFKDKLKSGAKKLFGSGQAQGMLMGLGNMATDALAANSINQQIAGLKQARVFNINPDFFNGANPNIASSNNYDMSAAIYAEAGAVVKNENVSGKGEVPIEAEGGEFYFDPNSMATIPIQGPSHEKGGVKFNAAEGSFIFSDSEKISGKMVNEIVGAKKLSDKKEYTISDVIRALPDFFDTKKEAEQLTKTTNDNIRNASLKHNMQKKADNLSLLLSYQQKKNGNHGEEDEQQMMQEEQPMATRGMMVFDPGGEVTDELQKDKKGRFIVNGKSIGKEEFAKVKATPQEQALHARNLLEAAKSGKKYYIPKEGPYAGLPFDISQAKMEGPESRKGKGISEVFDPYADVETATKAAAAFTANPTNTRQYTTPGAPGYFAGGINPDLVEKKFGGRDKLLTALKLDPKNYSADLWNDPNFEKDFFKAFETAYVPKDKWRPVHGDDHFFGLDYYDFIKEPDKPKTPPGTIPGTIPTIPGDTPPPPEEKPGKLYEEKLTPYDYARYFSDVATIVPEEYLQQTTPRYKPLNLLTAREQLNQAASTAAASNLSGTGVESIDAARQAAMYSGLLEQAGKATENVQNANRGIIDDYFQYNNAQFLNAQQANERAKADFVQRSMQNQQAAQETRRQAQEDFAEKSRDVSQFNAGLRFNEGIYSPQYSTFVDENGFMPVVGRDGTQYKFNPTTMMFGNLPGYAQSKVETEKDKKEKKKKGGKVKSTKRKLIK